MERFFSFNILLCLMILGLCLGSMVPELPDFVIWPWLILGTCIFLLNFIRLLFFSPFLIYAIGLLVAFGWSLHHGQKINALRIASDNSHKDWLLEGVIVNTPIKKDRVIQFDFYLTSVKQFPSNDSTQNIPQKIKLSYYFYRNLKINFEPGQRWKFKTRLKTPRGFINPHGFDYEGWLYRNNYHAVGYIKKSKFNTMLNNNDDYSLILRIKIFFERYAFQIKKWIDKYASESYKPYFYALMVGDKSLFDHSSWNVLSKTGTVHLMVVSGLHVGMASGMGYLFVSVLVRIFYFPLKIFPVYVWGAVGGIMFAGIYAAISSFSLPSQRALIMVACAMLYILNRSKSKIETIILLALVCILIWDPISIYSSSFWLSFGAVVILVLMMACRKEISQKFSYSVIKIARVQLILSICLAPLLAYWLGFVPLIMPITNLIAVPFVSLIVLPAMSLFILISRVSETAVQHWFAAVEALLSIFIDWLDYCSRISVELSVPLSIWGSVVVIISFVAIVFLLAPRQVVKNAMLKYCLVMGMLVSLLIPNVNRLPHSEFRLTVFDVGQGMSLLVETANHSIIYDVGEKYSNKFDVGRDIVGAHLLKKGIDELDLLIVSHSDKDHSGGLSGLLSVVKAKELYTGSVDKISHLNTESENTRLLVRSCDINKRWHYDGVVFEMLSAPQVNSLRNSNNQSCVLKISTNQLQMLVAGDIHSDREEEFIALYGKKLNADVLIAPHHGSKSSSSLEFISAVNPKLAIVSAGYKNRYYHPHPSVIRRYESKRIDILRTDLHGAIQINSSQPLDQARLTRISSPRYWHHWQ